MSLPFPPNHQLLELTEGLCFLIFHILLGTKSACRISYYSGSLNSAPAVLFSSCALSRLTQQQPSGGDCQGTQVGDSSSHQPGFPSNSVNKNWATFSFSYRVLSSFSSHILPLTLPGDCLSLLTDTGLILCRIYLI